MSVPMLPRAAKITGRVEIARSFSYKLSGPPLPDYQSRDFFCSQKVECDFAEAEEVSERVYQFCKSQVLKAVNEYLAEFKFRPQRKTA